MSSRRGNTNSRKSCGPARAVASSAAAPPRARVAATATPLLPSLLLLPLLLLAMPTPASSAGRAVEPHHLLEATIATVVHNFWRQHHTNTMQYQQHEEQAYDDAVAEQNVMKPRRAADPTGVYSPLKLGAEEHSVSRRDLPFVVQQQSETVAPCTSAASASIISGAKAVDFASLVAGILTLVININNNVNNNNNNNNNLNLNAVDSSNIAANFNTNNANQVNIMPGAGRRRRSVVGFSALSALAALQSTLALDSECATCADAMRMAARPNTYAERAIHRLIWALPVASPPMAVAA